ncbi:hypothetical protein [Streptomyces sp. NPDC054834]
MLRKPVVLHVWLNEERWAYAARFVFADDETISQLYRRDPAPPGQEEQLMCGCSGPRSGRPDARTYRMLLARSATDTNGKGICLVWAEADVDASDRALTQKIINDLCAGTGGR